MELAWKTTSRAAAGLLLAAGLAAAWYVWPSGAARRHQVVGGDVAVGGAQFGAGAFVVDGATVRAVGQWPARLLLADGSRVELALGSEASFHTARDRDQRLTVDLLAGAGRFDVPPGPGQFRVATPVGSVTVAGSQFSVRIGRGETRSLGVAVDRGELAVHFDGRDYHLAAGQSRIFDRRPRRKNGAPRVLRCGPRAVSWGQ